MSRKVVGELQFEWEIVNFLSLLGDAYESPVYSFGDTSWCIEVYPNGDMSEGYISVYVKRTDSGPPITVTYSTFLKTTGGRIKISNNAKKVFFEEKVNAWGQQKAMQRSELINQQSEFLPSGALTVICTLKFNKEQDVKTLESKVAAEDVKMLCDFKGLLKSEDNSDVTLEVGGQTFKAHRVILGARSPVFASMLKHNMKEKNTGLINIKDIDKAIFEDFLLFLYCGIVENLTSENVCSLFRAADKYDVTDLKSKCLTYMKSHLDVDIFCDVVTLALNHGVIDLIKQATDFFTKNIAKIIVTVKWQVFLAENPTESNELLIKAIVPEENQSA